MKGMLSASRKLLMALLSVCVFTLAIHSIAHANEEASAPIKIPDTVAGVWAAVDEHTVAIDKLIASNQLTIIHSHAFAIRDLIKALPGLSSNLSSDQVAVVKRDSGYVDQLAVRLDKTGDADDKDATVTSFNKLQKILGQIRANYNPIPNSANNK